MRTVVLALASVASLQGCAGVGYVVYDGSRKAAAPLIGQALAETAPGIDQDRGAQCILSGMKVPEIIALGTSPSTAVTPAYRAKVADVKGRPGVANCLTAVPVAP